MIESLTADAARRDRAALVALLRNVVDDGASVGFLPPLGADEAGRYWDGVATAVGEGTRLLWVARSPGEGAVGTVQLDLEKRANGDHRAELMKLMVHTGARRRGIARALMLAAEAEARRLGRTTLFLDTRRGDPSEILYQSLGWQLVGSIPRYARSASGVLDANAIYYRLLDSPSRLEPSPLSLSPLTLSPLTVSPLTLPSPLRREGEAEGERAG